MEEEKTIAKTIAEYVTALEFDNLPDYVVTKANDCILDLLGSIVAGSAFPWGKIVIDYVRELGQGRKESTILVYGEKVAAVHAALANATMAHSSETDDTYPRGLMHPGCVIVPSALAIGERERVDGRSFITAIVSGYEVMSRISRSVNPSHHVERGFNSTSTCGPFGAAIVASKVLDLSLEETANALSIAGMQCSGLTESPTNSKTGTPGGDASRIGPGIASQSGIMAALLAKKGLTGPNTIFEGEHGFCRAYSNNFDGTQIVKDLGKEFEMMKTGFKPFACCSSIHSPIDLVAKLVREYGIVPKEVDEVIVGTHRLASSKDEYYPRDRLSAQFSIPFSIALQLIKGGNSVTDYSEQNLEDGTILRMAQKIRVRLDNEVDMLFPSKLGCKVTIRLRNGKSYQDKMFDRRGDPGNPMTEQELEKKFRDLTLPMLPASRVNELIANIRKVDELPSLSDLTSLLTR